MTAIESAENTTYPIPRPPSLRRIAKKLLKRDLGLHNRRQVGWKPYKKAVTQVTNELKKLQKAKEEAAENDVLQSHEMAQ